METEKPSHGVNVPLLRKVLEHVTAHPEEWRQTWWATRNVAQSPCGTAYCIAGHAAVMSGLEVDWSSPEPGRRQNEAMYLTDGRRIDTVAAELLGISYDGVSSGDTIFGGCNDLRDVWRHAAKLSNGEIVVPAELPGEDS